MRLADLHDRRVVVLGAGRDVLAVLPTVLDARPGSVAVVDDRPEGAAEALAVAGIDGLDVVASIDDVPDAEVALRSPGFTPYRPDVARHVERGLVTVTSLGLWLTERGARPTIAVTGTKGKSSTSALLCTALGHLGLDAALLGNIGVPAWTRSPDDDVVAVVEVSSYLACDLPVTAPVAVLTSLAEDHLSWHGSMDRYLADKAKVFTAPVPADRRWCAAPADVELLGPFAGLGLHLVAVPPDDLRASNARLAAAAALAHVAGAATPERGAVDELAEVVGADYPDLPGRFSTIATRGGVEFVDDALASAPLGLAAALRTLTDRPVAAIVGGTDRGASIEPVLAAVAARSAPTHLVLIDDAASHEGRHVAAGATAEVADDLEAAVARALEALPGGGVLLFSPGMPTPPAQGDWAARSERFRQTVEALDR